MNSTFSLQALTFTTVSLIAMAVMALVVIRPARAVGEPSSVGEPISGGWVRADETPVSEPAVPVVPTLASGDGELNVTWAAPASNGSPIVDYDVRYRQERYSIWQGAYDGGTVMVPIGKEISDGPGGDPVDLGDIASGLGATLTREAIGSNYGVYKLDRAVGGLRIKFTGSMTSSGTVRARYAETKPTAATLDSHGTQLWSATSENLLKNPFNLGVPWGSSRWGFGGSRSADRGRGSVPNGGFAGFNPVSGSGVTPPLAAGSYIWLETAAPVIFSSMIYTFSVDLATTATTRTISDLKNGKQYEVQVRAANAVGEGEWSAAATSLVGAPGAPSDLITTTGDGQVSVEWDAPADNGSPVIDYDMRYSSDGGDTWSEFFDGGMASGTNTKSDTSNGPEGDPVDLGEITGLSVPFVREAVGSNYGVYKLGGPVDKLWFRVWIHYIQGLIYFRKPADMQARYASTMPTADNLMTHGTQLWSSRAVFGWPNFKAFGYAYTPPLAAGSYVWVVISEAETVVDSKWLIYADLSSTATAATITGLTNGTAYKVQVRAVNSRGAGSWSASSEAVTVGAPSAGVVTGAPPPDAPPPVGAPSADAVTDAPAAPST